MEIDNNSKISMVLPVYNGERFLGQAIESILAQVYTNWELIIVNDCSTDSSESIMIHYAQMDDRIKIINNPDNLKLPRSLNVGFKIATGDYFTWTSDDNLLKPNMLKRLCEELDASQEYGLVYSNHDEIDEEGVHIRDNILGEPDDMGKTGNVCGASFLYRRSVAELVGEYDPDLFLAEDYEAILPVLDEMPHIRVRGIMVIAPNTPDQDVLHTVFRQGYEYFCKLKRQRNDIDYLSMGMTSDYAIAVEEGANMVRVGTALFGARDYSNRGY